MMILDYKDGEQYHGASGEDWRNGLCGVFAYALCQRFGFHLKALVVKESDGFDSLLHAVAQGPDGSLFDASGRIGNQDALIKTYRDQFSDDEIRQITLAEGPIELLVRGVTLKDLEEMNPEDICATKHAHEYINNHSELFFRQAQPDNLDINSDFSP